MPRPDPTRVSDPVAIADRPSLRARRARLLLPLAALLGTGLAGACTVRAPEEGDPQQAAVIERAAERDDPTGLEDVPPGGEVPVERAEAVLLYRAAEVTREAGMEGFRIVAQDVDPETRRDTGAAATGGYRYAPVSWHRVNSLAGPRGDDAKTVESYKSYARIQMFAEAPAVSGENGIYDARDVLRRFAALGGTRTATPE